MEQEFRNWLERSGKYGAAKSYPKAIHSISEHYSGETNKTTGIYAITDQVLISQIARDYKKAGRFAAFGDEHHGTNRNAIARYAEFFVSVPAHEEPMGLPLEGEEPSNQTAQQLVSNFAYEKDLQTTLCAQITELFPNYRIFGNSGLGIEYAIGDRRIDVLLESMDGSGLLAVELKSGVADYKVFGQVSMYMGLLMEQFPNRNINGVIVAGGIDPSLKQACSITDKVALRVYRMSLELEDA